MKATHSQEFKHDLSFEDQLLSLLRESGRPLSIDTISFLLEVPAYRVAQELVRLSKWKLVSKSTAKTVSYWEAEKERQNKDASE